MVVYKKNSDVLQESVALEGKLVLDIGCGDGALARLMAGQGAHVIGIETSPVQLAKARATPRVADEAFCLGSAQALPMTDGMADVVVFSNSLHHVPVAFQPQALAEAARVLKPGGTLFIAEPLAEGPHFDMTRIVEDETVVRTKALEAIHAADRWGLEAVSEQVHISANSFPDFEALRQRQIAVDAERAAIVAARQDELRAAFERLGQRTDKGWLFDQPMRINLLRKRAS